MLVVDIGGGTMHVVLVRLSPQGAQGGQARVLGQAGRPLGGNAVDGWVLADLLPAAGRSARGGGDDERTRLWRRLMLAEACRVKEAVFFAESEEFLFIPPGARAARGPRPSGRGSSPSRGPPGRAPRGERVPPRPRGVLDEVLEERPGGRGRGGRRPPGRRLDAPARGLPPPRGALRAAPAPGLAAVRGGGLRRGLLRRRPDRRPGLHRPRLRLRDPRREDRRGAAHGDRAAGHPLPDHAGALEAAARAHLLPGRARDDLQAPHVRGGARETAATSAGSCGTPPASSTRWEAPAARPRWWCP